MTLEPVLAANPAAPREERRSVSRNRLAAIVAAVIAGAVGGLAQWGEGPLAAGLFVVQVVLTLAWVAALDSRGSLGSVLLGLTAAGVADGWTASDPTGGLLPLLVVTGLALLAGLAQQLWRRPRPGVIPSLAATGSLVVIVTAAATVLGLPAVTRHAGDCVTAGMFGLAAALLGSRLIDLGIRRPPIAVASSRGLPGAVIGIGLAAAAGAGWGSSAGLPFGGAGVGARIAVVTAVVGLVADAAVDVAAAGRLDARVRSALVPLTALLPAALAGPGVFVAARALLG